MFNICESSSCLTVILWAHSHGICWQSFVILLRCLEFCAIPILSHTDQTNINTNRSTLSSVQQKLDWDSEPNFGIYQNEQSFIPQRTIAIPFIVLSIAFYFFPDCCPWEIINPHFQTIFISFSRYSFLRYDCCNLNFCLSIPCRLFVIEPFQTVCQ